MATNPRIAAATRTSAKVYPVSEVLREPARGSRRPLFTFQSNPHNDLFSIRCKRLYYHSIFNNRGRAVFSSRTDSGLGPRGSPGGEVRLREIGHLARCSSCSVPPALVTAEPRRLARESPLLNSPRSITASNARRWPREHHHQPGINTSSHKPHRGRSMAAPTIFLGATQTKAHLPLRPAPRLAVVVAAVKIAAAQQAPI